MSDEDDPTSQSPALPAAVLAVLTAAPAHALLPAELANLRFTLAAAYRAGLPPARLRAVALPLLRAVEVCPQTWPPQTCRLAEAIAVLRQVMNA
jgi:hypothetical protein